VWSKRERRCPRRAGPAVGVAETWWKTFSQKIMSTKKKKKERGKD
jgi:hypothetical protein